MQFDISKNIEIDITPRIEEVMNDFDIKLEHSNEHFCGDIPIENTEWNIGLIVGGSGTGKTTIAKELFKDSYISDDFNGNCSVLDSMPKNKTTKEIELAFTNVGFSSPPSWLKPYEVLSTGEKMRVRLANALLSDKELIVFDEFTSVVDRNVAQTCSQAIQKAIRNNGKKFVAISCHYDIIDFLCPDWIYDTEQKRFFGQRECICSLKEKSTYTKLTDLISKQYGNYLGSITI